MMTAASPSRHPSPAGTAKPSVSRCISKLAIPRTVTGTTIGRLRQFRPATISRAATATSTTGNDKSAAADSQNGTSAETRQISRPNSHRPTSSARGRPLIGSRRVQFGIAVNRNPAMAAITKPNSISWICQLSGSKRLGSVLPVTSMPIQIAMAAIDQIPAARKNGLNPWVKIAGVPRAGARWTTALMAR